MNPVDIIFGIVLALALLRGYMRGLLGVAAAWVAPVLGIVVAAKWSAPVRDRLAEAMPHPELAADVLAPFFVFVAVIVVVRASAAAVAKSMGVGLSAPSRVAAASASAVVSGLLLGLLVVLVHELRPEPRPNLFPDPDQPETLGDAMSRPVEDLMLAVDRTFSESVLAPPLGAFADAVVSTALHREQNEPLLDPEQLEAAARKAANAAVDAVGKASVAHQERPGDARGDR